MRHIKNIHIRKVSYVSAGVLLFTLLGAMVPIVIVITNDIWNWYRPVPSIQAIFVMLQTLTISILLPIYNQKYEDTTTLLRQITRRIQSETGSQANVTEKDIRKVLHVNSPNPPTESIISTELNIPLVRVQKKDASGLTIYDNITALWDYRPTKSSAEIISILRIGNIMLLATGVDDILTDQGLHYFWLIVMIMVSYLLFQWTHLLDIWAHSLDYDMEITPATKIQKYD